MKMIKKAQKGGCLSTTGSGTRTSIYKSAAGESGSGRADGKAAKQFARAERKIDKAQAKMDREEAKAAAKAPKSEYGSKIKKAQTGDKVVPSEMKPGKMIKKADRDVRADSMAKSLDKASVLGKKFVPASDTAKKKLAPKKKMQYGGEAASMVPSNPMMKKGGKMVKKSAKKK